MRSDHYDLIVIGSGPGGASLAQRVARTGKRILLLERGDYLPRSPANWDSKTVFVDGAYQAQETWFGTDGRSFHPGLHGARVGQHGVVVECRVAVGAAIAARYQRLVGDDLGAGRFGIIRLDDGTLGLQIPSPPRDHGGSLTEVFWFFFQKKNISSFLFFIQLISQPPPRQGC